MHCTLLYYLNVMLCMRPWLILSSIPILQEPVRYVVQQECLHVLQCTIDEDTKNIHLEAGVIGDVKYLAVICGHQCIHNNFVLLIASRE
jgi:hypothetical protein